MSSQTHYGATGDLYNPAESERDRRLRLREEERKLRKFNSLFFKENKEISFYYFLLNHCAY